MGYNLSDYMKYTFSRKKSNYAREVTVMKNTIIILTDRRFYFQGIAYDIDGTKSRMEKIINIEDITGVGFVHSSKILFLILSIILYLWAFTTADNIYITGRVFVDFLCLSIIPTLMLYFYFLSMKAFFHVEYAGGAIIFKVSLFDYENIQIFEKNIRMAMDKRKGDIINVLSGKIL